MNYGLFYWINEAAGHYAWLDKTMIFIASKSPYMTAAIMLWIWFSSKQKESLAKNQRAVVSAAVAMAVSLLCNKLIHAAYFHPRPFASHSVHQLIAHANDSSFVSDHGIMVFSLAFACMFYGLKSYRWVFFFALTVGFSRIYVGVHYPIDIIGSMTLAFLVTLALKKSKHLLEKPYIALIGMYNAVARKIPLTKNYVS